MLNPVQCQSSLTSTARFRNRLSLSLSASLLSNVLCIDVYYKSLHYCGTITSNCFRNIVVILVKVVISWGSWRALLFTYS